MDTYTLPILLEGEHWTITAVRLNAFTDEIDTPVHRDTFHYFRGRIAEDVTGDLFFLENEHDGNAYVLVAECADFETATLRIKERTVTVEAECPVTVISCKKGECEAVCRCFYRQKTAQKELVTMSNTWGDCNGFSRVCEEFVLREIDRAAELGLDIVQVDDGWQLGRTDDRSLRDERGRRFFPDDFWLVNEERFPSGMRYLAEYGASKGVKLGLWFAPESKEHFVCMERDLAILKKAYEEWGFRFFKLDMYWVESVEDRERFLEYLRRIDAFGPDVSVQLDVTRFARVNYLCGREHGTVFVENRYTKTGTYFPHRTLKNLWLLSRYLPASRLQFEVVNPALNRETYAETDEFAPCRYGIDYLFASVMLSNPLFWMELQYLSSENAEKLQKMIALWKEYRPLFSEGDVSPLGECPAGRSITGFLCKGEKQTVALVLREASTEKEAVLALPEGYKAAKVLRASTVAKAEAVGRTLRVEMDAPYSWALLSLQK